MKKDIVITLLNRYLNLLKEKKVTTTVLIKMDVKNGGVGRVRASLEHDLNTFFADEARNDKPRIN